MLLITTENNIELKYDKAASKQWLRCELLFSFQKLRYERKLFCVVIDQQRATDFTWNVPISFSEKFLRFGPKKPRARKNM